MTIFTYNGRRYYSRKKEALNARRKGDRIYYNSKRKGYYIVRPKKRNSFWRI